MPVNSTTQSIFKKNILIHLSNENLKHSILFLLFIQDNAEPVSDFAPANPTDPNIKGKQQNQDMS